MRSILGGRGGLILLVLLVVIGPGAAMGQNSGAGDENLAFEPRAQGVETVPGEIIVKFEEDAGLAAQADARRDESLDKKRTLDIIDAEVVEVEGQSVESAIRDLERRPGVEYAEPNFVYRAAGYADEPRFPELWGLHNTGQTISGSPASRAWWTARVPGIADVDMNALEASSVTQGDPNLVVAVIDTGVDFSHPDLAARAWRNPGESGGGKATNGVDDDGNGFVDDVNGADFVNNDGDPFNDDGHGTLVAGALAGSANGQGIVGVAPNVKIMGLKIFYDGGGGTGSAEAAIRAIEYARDKGVKISNNSWGCVTTSDDCYGQALKDAIEASDSLFVAAAGNLSSGDPIYPAAYDSPNILSVAAIDNRGDLAPFSNYGTTSVDISAPGVGILSTIPGSPTEQPAVALSSVGASGKALTAGFGADEIRPAADRASFFTKAFAAVERGSQQVVLVDDSIEGRYYGREATDVGPTLSAAIQTATGSAPTVIDVAECSDGPALSSLAGKTVVWATGQAIESSGCGYPLTNTDRTTLTDFLNGGGKLVITGRGALLQAWQPQFEFATLNVMVDDGVPGATTFRGAAGTAFAGEIYDLSSRTADLPNGHDALTPVNASAVTQGVYPANDGAWEYADGTSMAAPYATGVAALAASVDPALLSDPVDLKNRVMNNGKPVPATNCRTVTGDVVDARAALNPTAALAANDDFANAQAITGANATVTGNNSNATQEVGEPTHYRPAQYLGCKSVWYRWTPRTSGAATIDTFGTSFDTFLGVFTGSAINALGLKAGNDNVDGGRQSRVSFAATAGETYRIVVSARNGANGDITLNLAQDITAPRVVGVNPANDATEISQGANVRAVFSEEMKPSSINTNTFKLRKQGATESVAATVTYDPATRRATLDPEADLQAGARYIATVTNWARDVAGNRLDQNPNIAGNQTRVWAFSVQ